MNTSITALTMTLILFLSACANNAKPSATSPVPPNKANQQLMGHWLVEYIDSKPVIDKSPAKLIFLDKNKLAGSASCNNISARYNKNAEKLSITKVATTRRMCTESLMTQETRFLKALAKVERYQIKHGMLYLYSENKQIVFKASRSQTVSR